MRKWIFVVIAIYLSSGANGQPLASISSILPTAQCFASRSTWYADNQHGACSYGPSLGTTGNGNMYIAATSKSVWADSADCGACYEITGPSGTVVVTVVDQCTDGGVCDTSFPHIDISPEAFDVIADRTIAGVTSTIVRRIACPTSGNVKLAVGSQYFYATNWEILIYNTRYPIRMASVTFSGTTYYLTRQTYNYWLYNGPAVTWPATIAVTDINGAVVTFPATTLKSGLLADAGAQFPSLLAIDSLQSCASPIMVNTDGWIYQDSLSMQYTDINYINVFSWLDWSYNAQVSWASTVSPYSGTSCIQATISAYGALQIGHSYSFTFSSLFTSLSFAVRGSAPYSGLTVGFKTGGSVPLSITTSWQVITLDLVSNLKAPSIIGGTAVPLVFGNQQTTTTPTLYFDNIRLIPSPTASATTAAPTPTTTTAPTTTTTPAPTTTKAPVTTTTTKAPTTNPPIVAATERPTTTSTTTQKPATTTTTTPTTAPASGCAVTTSQTFIRSWVNGGTTYSQWSAVTTNASPTKLITSLSISTQQYSQLSQGSPWTVVSSSTAGVYGLPSYLAGKGLAGGGSFEWGYIASGSTSLTFTASAQC